MYVPDHTAPESGNSSVDSSRSPFQALYKWTPSLHLPEKNYWVKLEIGTDADRAVSRETIYEKTEKAQVHSPDNLSKMNRRFLQMLLKWKACSGWGIPVIGKGCQGTPGCPETADTTFISRVGTVGFLEDQWFYQKQCLNIVGRGRGREQYNLLMLTIWQTICHLWSSNPVLRDVGGRTDGDRYSPFYIGKLTEPHFHCHHGQDVATVQSNLSGNLPYGASV